MDPVVKDIDWVLVSTEPNYVWGLLVWTATARELGFATNAEKNPFCLPFEPLYRVKAQNLKILASRKIHEESFGLSRLILTPRVTRLGTSSMVIETTIELVKQPVEKRLREADVAKYEKIMLAKNSCVLVFVANERPVKHPFKDLDKINRFVIESNEGFKGYEPKGEKYKLFETNFEADASEIDGVGHVHNANYIYVFWNQMYRFLMPYIQKDLLTFELSILNFAIEYISGLNALEETKINVFSEARTQAEVFAESLKAGNSEDLFMELSSMKTLSITTRASLTLCLIKSKRRTSSM